MALLSNDERIHWLRQERWIQYPRAERILERLLDLVDPPRDRMPCLLIYGASGMGKTRNIEKFLRDNRSHFALTAKCIGIHLDLKSACRTNAHRGPIITPWRLKQTAALGDRLLRLYLSEMNLQEGRMTVILVPKHLRRPKIKLGWAESITPHLTA